MLRLTIQEAASLLNAYGVECHWHEVKKWVIEGRIKSIQEYRVYRIDEKEVYRFLESYTYKKEEITEKSKLFEEDEELPF